LDIKTLIAVIAMTVGLATSYLVQDRRITRVETSFQQEQTGYNIAIHGINERLNRFEKRTATHLEKIDQKLDKLVERSR